ncbi:fam-l protein [Plasmodium malariae]|uniref:Fam-l protein n=1 Tax=Plasmodium malariae TaxID=5858 RepID=A0A1D3JHY2_PLAMA|nr:fam-l protein [Plasmodium malariae]SBT85841.1 fam-l protein [Plasmodium malariae]
MRQNIKSILFIDIAYFILLSSIYNFNNLTSTINKYFHGTNIIFGKSNTRSYRLLEKCKKDMDPRIVCLKEVTSKGMNKTNYISNNEKMLNGRSKQLNGSLSRSSACHKQNIKNNSCVFAKKCSSIEKKIFKELDFIDFLKKNSTISNKTYKKVISKKYGLRIATPALLFCLLLILVIVDFSLGISIEKSLPISLASWDPLEVSKAQWFMNIFNEIKKLDWFWKSQLWTTSERAAGSINKAELLGRFCGILIYFLPFLILCVVFILALVYYHKKVKKYEKIKFKKR